MTSKVTLSFSLTISEPYNVSISNPKSAESLKLVATVKQETSPFPNRAVTLLTLHSVLNNGKPDAFFKKLMGPLTDVDDDEFKIYMHPVGFQLNCRSGPQTRIPRQRDMRQRKGLNFITVPPPGKGSVDTTWPLAPENILRYYNRKGSLEEELRKFTVGQRFNIEVGSGSKPIWWTWGSLQHDLKDKKFSRWSLPRDLSIIREAGQDEGDEVDRGLVDVVNRTRLDRNIKKWNRSDKPDDPNVEEPLKVKEMRADGWVFGQLLHALQLICDQTATLEFVE